MQILLGGIVLFLIFLYVTNKYKTADPKDILYSMRWLFVGGVLLFVLFLVATGKIQLVWLALLSLLPWVRRFFMAKSIYQRFTKKPSTNDKSSTDSNSQSSQKNSAHTGPMDRTAACRILGVPSGASENEIRTAHRELMKKHHPDTGGSVEMAALVNQAKDFLLS